jgi:adenosylcobyric acid synthase
MTARAIMFMGTGSDVGKSLIVAGLCRLLANRGIKVAPFKPQNMSNNAAAITNGGEIGRAQALQARAARVMPSVHMNPVLLKPESETGAQIIVQGKRAATLSARAFFAERQQYLPAIAESFRHLAKEHEFILVEGAGSPAETNLRDGDLANMGFAQASDVPAILIGDIHRGGVIASLVGTHTVLAESDRDCIKGFLINKLHGDPRLFDEGRDTIVKTTGWPCLGVVPHFPEAARLPAEDALALDNRLQDTSGAGSHICVFRLPRIANFDDLDPLRLHPGVRLSFVSHGDALPADCRLAILPGSKSTIADLAYFRAQGWDIDLAAHVRRGGHVLGLCGGYQMLGRRIHDPEGLEGRTGSVDGLGLLAVETALCADKTIREITATHCASGQPISGYEIHLGETSGPDCARPFAVTAYGPEGAMSADGRVMGTYLHGCFSSDGFRDAMLRALGATSQGFAYEALIEETLDQLAAHLEANIDVARLLALAAPVQST